MTIDQLTGNIEPRGLEEEMKSSYLDYAMSVIVGRALPDARDGLKPVHRRVLYAMNEAGMQPNRPYAKCARIVGDVMGNYHPHGDSAIYDTLVRLAQDFSMRYLLADGQGNFGSIDDDPPAAMRYTEARLSRMATEMLRDLDADTVDFVPNYDGRTQEPLVLPSRFPNLLVNGSQGIAVGMATNIPPHNLRETIRAAVAYIDNPDITVEGLMKHIKGPDFPTGGVILGTQGIRDAYDTGRGRVRVQARAHIEPLSHGKEAIVVTELPWMVKKGGDGGLIQKIADLVHDKKITEISDIKDLSDKRGMRVVIELKRDQIPKVVLNKLFKHTPLQTTFGVNMVALVDGVPQTLSLREAIGAYVDHQREVITRRTKYELRKAEARAHILAGLLVAIDNLDAVIDLIRAARDRDTARLQLIERFDLSVIQANAILDLRLAQLTALEAGAIRTEYEDKLELVKELREILGDESRVLGLIKEELAEIAERYGDERRTDITHAEGEIDVEDLIADQQMVITITKSGYVKSLPLATYRKQRRGGVGVTGMDMKDGDYIEHLFICSTHDYLLFFTNRGKVYRLEGLRAARGAADGQGPRAGQPAAAARRRARPVGALDARLLRGSRTSCSRPATARSRRPSSGSTTRRSRPTASSRSRSATTTSSSAVRRVSEGDEILMVSRAGMAVRFREDDARAMGRDTSGVRGMNISGEGNAVLTMDVARDDQELLVVTENGFGKRTPVDQYRKTSRGAKGVTTIKFSERRGELVAALVVRPHQELVFISETGMVQRTGVKGIRQTGRPAQGVRLMNVRDDDRVSAVALVVESEADTSADVIEDPSQPPASARTGRSRAIPPARTARRPTAPRPTAPPRTHERRPRRSASRKRFGWRSPWPAALRRRDESRRRSRGCRGVDSATRGQPPA